MLKQLSKFLLVFFLIPLISFADGTTAEFCATGFGTANVDGTYTYVDSAGGNFYSQMPERYSNGNGYFIYTIAGSSSILLDSTIGDASPNYYYKNFVDAQNGDYTEIAGSWNIENLGASPAGTITDCTPEPPAPPFDDSQFGISTSTPMSEDFFLSDRLIKLVMNFVILPIFMLLLIAIPIRFMRNPDKY